MYCHRQFPVFIILLLFPLSLCAQFQIEDISPRAANTNITQPSWFQSVSSIGYTVAMSGWRVYLGGESGVWRSDDGGANWQHMVQPQPPSGSTLVNGALLCPNINDLLTFEGNPDLVLAAASYSLRKPSKDGIYRSSDGGSTWTLVYQFTGVINNTIGKVYHLNVAPDDPLKIYAAGEFGIAKSADGGINWTGKRMPDNSSVTSIAIGPLQAGQRRLYAAGDKVWYSLDDGNNWIVEPGALAQNLKVGSPSFKHVSPAGRVLAINPLDPDYVYLSVNGKLWRGDFNLILVTLVANWTPLPSPPENYPKTAHNGADYIVVNRTLTDRKLFFIFSNRATTHICIGEPGPQNAWKRIDQPNVHIDPHAVTFTPDFRYRSLGGAPGYGRIILVSDGGAYFSTDGGITWKQGKGLSTLEAINIAILPRLENRSGISFGGAHNSGFFSGDGGKKWKTLDYVGGDNDVIFSDPFQPSKLYVFAPRPDNRLYYYSVAVDEIPDGADGTGDRDEVPSPAGGGAGWNAGSHYFNLGNRPLLLTLHGQVPRPGGDFLIIRYADDKAYLTRTTKIGSISNSAHWVTTSDLESSGHRAFRQGPILPAPTANVVQATGGHDDPVFYVADIFSRDLEVANLKKLWKWKNGMDEWEQVVPALNDQHPKMVTRFFADPYRPNIYVLSDSGIYFSANAGANWTRDTLLENAITENGAFPLAFPASESSLIAVLQDMVFDPLNPGYRFAVGPAGVFYTIDGVHWDHFLLTAAMPMRPNSLSYNPCERTLYVATTNRGVLKIFPLPPEYEGIAYGGVYGVEGKINLLRVHDPGTKYGPVTDQIDAEVIVLLDTRPNEAFGFQLRKDGDEKTNQGMLALLRQAFKTDKRVRIDYKRINCTKAVILRIMLL